jgi:ribosomal protein S27E
MKPIIIECPECGKETEVFGPGKYECSCKMTQTIVEARPVRAEKKS